MRCAVNWRRFIVICPCMVTYFKDPKHKEHLLTTAYKCTSGVGSNPSEKQKYKKNILAENLLARLG